MKTYRIKPLEWEDNNTVKLTKAAFGYAQINREGRKEWSMLHKRQILDFDSLKAAKAKAQELHERELLKYLEPTE